MNNYIKYKTAITNIDNLPSYPIPDMKKTLARYLSWVKPLVSAEELADAKESVDLFLQSKDSQFLENKIIELGSKENDSWIFDQWVKCHLKIRAPLTPHTNVPIIYNNQLLINNDSIEKMAVVMQSCASVYMDLKENGARAYKIKNKQYSSDEIHGLFASMNEIKEGMDHYYINDEYSESVIFSYKNHMFDIKVIEDGKLTSASNILHSLNMIINDITDPIVPSLNYVTVGVDRDEAGLLLDKLLKVESNQSGYDKIKNAIMVMNYDCIETSDIYDELKSASYNIEHVNRWHGKGLQFTCNKNGAMALVADHCFVDGGTEVYLMNKINEFISLQELQFDSLGQFASYTEINFDIPTPFIEPLNNLKIKFDKCMDSFQVKYQLLDGLTRTKLKDNGILSGDGFFHLALQVAQYMTYNCINNTYISVDARKYFRGRTESNRPVSEQSVAFAHALIDQTHKGAELREMMMDSLNEHHRRVKLCQQGEGVNRYLYVLESLSEEYCDELELNTTHSIFATKAIKKIAENYISATSFTHQDMKYLYFPPVQKHGIGVYYHVGNESFIIISAFNEDVEDLNKLTKNLNLAIAKMLEL